MPAKGYSNFSALTALVRASLQSTLKSPSAIVFSIAFPLIFILVFGFLGGDKAFSVKVTAGQGVDTTSGLYKALAANKAIKWVQPGAETTAEKMLSEGDIAAIIDISEQPQGALPRYHIELNSSTAQGEKLMQLRAIIDATVQGSDPVIRGRMQELVAIETHMATIREFKTIDFILPGQLGFSLLAGSVFGTAFIFFSLRETLVLKRFFATPIRREVIVVSEGIARMIFQLMGAAIIILVGYFVFGYTLVNGAVTVLEMLLLCALAIFVFMGFGFIISGLAKSQSTIPPLSNIITLPQFLLAGTFFPIDVFPKWLQPFCRILPLTYLNDALRKIAFDNAGLWDVKLEIGVLLVWGVAVYVVAARVFKWE